MTFKAINGVTLGIDYPMGSKKHCKGEEMVGETGVEPAVRPPHRLGNVAKVAPSSWRRHPHVPKLEN